MRQPGMWTGNIKTLDETPEKGLLRPGEHVEPPPVEKRYNGFTVRELQAKVNMRPGMREDDHISHDDMEFIA